MKRLLKTSKIIVLSFIFVLFFASFIVAVDPGYRDCPYDDCPYDSEVYDLTEEQEEDLVFMYEEEKMARDLYAAFNEEWNARIFENISQSEENHMAAIARLLDKYDLEKPDLDPGEFNNQELAELYQELLEKGLTSYEDALEVGKTVEIIDIEDLETKAARATPDVETVFMNLLNGSYNHLAAFERQLESDVARNGEFRRDNDRGNRRGGGNSRRFDE